MPSPGSAPQPVRALQAAGQQVWLDDLSRTSIQSGLLVRAIEQWGVTGVTSNPAIVARAVRGNSAYDAAIARQAGTGSAPEQIAMGLAVEDVAGAADLLRKVWVESGGADGWVSIQLPPRLADDTAASVEAALMLHERVGRSNVLIKMPATEAGVPAIEEVLAAGVPVTVTLLLTPGHVAEAAGAFVRAIERRAAAGAPLDVRSYAALYVSRWDRDLAPDAAGLGIAVADAAYGASRSVFSGPRWEELTHRGARPQTLLFASTASRDPELGAGYYVERLAAAGTANTVPPDALEAFVSGGSVRSTLRGEPDELERLAGGVDVDARGAELQAGAASGSADAWNEPLVELERRAGAAAG